MSFFTLSPDWTGQKQFYEIAKFTVIHIIPSQQLPQPRRSLKIKHYKKSFPIVPSNCYKNLRTVVTMSAEEMAYTKEVTSVFSDLFTNLFIKKDFSENKWAHSLYIQSLCFCYNVFVRSINDTFFLLFLEGNRYREKHFNATWGLH